MRLAPIVVFDLDGTLANTAHRNHLIDGSFEGYHNFHVRCGDDGLYAETSVIAKALNRSGFLFWVVTSRPIEVLEKTRAWFFAYMVVPDNIIMRPIGNTQSGAELKRSWLSDGTLPRDRIFCVFDDEDASVKMWREEGLTCYQVWTAT